jgi:hypothetical protein
VFFCFSCDFWVITLSIGTGLFLSRFRLAGLLSTIGLSSVFHVVWAWWYTTIFLDKLGMVTPTIVVTYTLLSIAFFVLLGLAIHAIFSDKKLNYKFDNINLPNGFVQILTILPVVLLIIVLVFTWPSINK